MGLNKWIGYGRLCADPELRQTSSGVSVCRLRVAVNRNYRKDGQPEADFINCTAWRQTAEFCARYFTKGSAIIIEGSLQNRDYTDGDGVKHYGMEIAVENVSFGESKNNQSTRHNTQAQQNSANIQQAIGDLGEFEEILSDGEVPF